jgi:hypothetical protein
MQRRGGSRRRGLVPRLPQIVRRYLLAWGFLALACGMYLSGLILGNPSQVKVYQINFLVQGAGVFTALGLAWLFFEKRSQEQDQRIRLGVHQRLRLIRNSACWPVTNLTARLFDTPSLIRGRAGPDYLRYHSHDIRSLLAGNESKNSGDGENGESTFENLRSMENFRWIFEEFIDLSTLCDRTMGLFGPALMQYSDLLEAIEALQGGVESQRRAWLKFQGDMVERERDYERWMNANEQYKQQRKQPPYPDHLPLYAIRNLQTLAVRALALVVAITFILGDWDPMPDGSDSKLRGALWAADRGPEPWGATDRAGGLTPS